MSRTPLEGWAALGGLLAGCSGPALQGADAVLVNELPRGTPVARYTPANCKNARGEPAPAPVMAVERRSLARGREILIELRPGYDAIVVTNAERQGSDSVFRFTSDDDSGPAVLHELRVPVEPAAAGRLRLSDDFEGELGDRASQPRVKTAVLDCTLVPSREAARLDTSRALE